MELNRIKQLAGLEQIREELLTEACTDQQAEALMKVFATRQFDKWYKGEFEDYLSGELEDKDREKIINNIKKLFKNI